ncbi:MULTISPECIES: helix-turn-helix transcriptional regulator [Streptosporangium]|uniref:DNA-binding transcriptional regulator YafY n=1 Tax=Streptosporangium brasiliense TaxID=47480 RepID=A0ABT9RD95_9ACTN|nr:WYL domain-containing protein [Streptosporangium brasiliense]MDP9866375.1 putative DNA-binding transcriptional regulator YafY [Streptosporangium brasiliense]
MNRTDRLYALVEELRAISPRSRSARELAAGFEVSVRTVERDISALQRSGVPIYAEPGRRGGYALGESMSLPPLDLTPAEAAAVVAALERAGGDPSAHHARSALRKLVAAMSPAESAEDVESIESAGDVESTGAGDVESAEDVESAGAGGPAVRVHAAVEPEPYPRVSRVIGQALLHRRVLRIRYEDHKGRVTTREVEPAIFVGGRGGHWYLVGMCRLRQDARVFRLDRIGWAEETDESSPEHPPERFAPQLPQVITGTPETG